MFSWLFTEEHKKKVAQEKADRKALRTGIWERQTSKPDNASRPMPAPDMKPPRNSWSSNKVTQISRGNNSANVNISNNGTSYQRTVRNGVESVVLNGKVLTGAEAKAAKVKYESWVDDFKEDMADFAEDMRDMAKDMRDMFK